MTAVRVWTGREARALRRALRMSVRAFAEELGVGVRTISKWEKLGEATVPRPVTQAILDTALARADAIAQMRFHALLAESGALAHTYTRRPADPSAWEYESWTDDLERAVVALSRQSFASATSLLERWLTRYPPDRLDRQGMYLHARSLVLLADARRDQGKLIGPLSAAHTYQKALSLFTELDNPRRVAQVQLALAVVTEMTGGLHEAARRYQALASDERLSGRDRARSRLWIGTALSKAGEHEYAAGVMVEAVREFEELGETEDWATAQQKLALAYRGIGALDQTSCFIDIARSSGTTETPMQRVRLDTAHAHILLSDKATCDHGLRLLDKTAQAALAGGLTHQLHSIQAIRRGFEEVGRRPAVRRTG